MKEKFGLTHTLSLLRKEQGTYEPVCECLCREWSRKIHMKPIQYEATKGTKLIELSQAKTMQMIWAYCLLLPSPYVISFVSSFIQESSSLLCWKHLHECHAEKCHEVWRHLFKPYLQIIQPSALVIRPGFLLTCSFTLTSLKWDGGKTEPPSKLHVGTEKWSLTRIPGMTKSTYALAEAVVQGQCQSRKCPDG